METFLFISFWISFGLLVTSLMQVISYVQEKERKKEVATCKAKEVDYKHVAQMAWSDKDFMQKGVMKETEFEAWWEMYKKGKFMSYLLTGKEKEDRADERRP